MKMQRITLLAVLLLGACTDRPSDTGAATPGIQHAPAAAEPSATIGDSERSLSRPDDAAQGKAAMATGTVESVDAATGKITISHGPVGALQWPAMTMGFDATPAQIEAVKPGQKVEFQFNSKGPKNTIVYINPME